MNINDKPENNLETVLFNLESATYINNRLRNEFNIKDVYNNYNYIYRENYIEFFNMILEYEINQNKKRKEYGRNIYER